MAFLLRKGITVFFVGGLCWLAELVGLGLSRAAIERLRRAMEDPPLRVHQTITARWRNAARETIEWEKWMDAGAPKGACRRCFFC